MKKLLLSGFAFVAFLAAGNAQTTDTIYSGDPSIDQIKGVNGAVWYDFNNPSTGLTEPASGGNPGTYIKYTGSTSGPGGYYIGGFGNGRWDQFGAPQAFVFSASDPSTAMVSFDAFSNGNEGYFRIQFTTTPGGKIFAKQFTIAATDAAASGWTNFTTTFSSMAQLDAGGNVIAGAPSITSAEISQLYKVEFVLLCSSNGGNCSSELDIDNIILSAPNTPPSISNQTFSVAADSTIGTVVGTVVASDPDTGQTLSYAITAGNSAGKFAINDSTGVITVAGSLNSDTTSSYSLTVMVTDNGSSPLSSSATVTIDITGVNKAPVITDQTFSIPQNSADSTVVGTVVASDPDTGDTLTYAITAGNSGGNFVINDSTGVIMVIDTTNFSTAPTYTLTVAVMDNGMPALTSSATITINVTQVVVTGISTALANSQVSVYPNPSSGAFTIQSGVLSLDDNKIRIMNAMGETVYSSQFSQQLNLQQLPKGVYSLMLENDKGIIIKQIIIQ
jgi:VCBS repeat-containing protein